LASTEETKYNTTKANNARTKHKMLIPKPKAAQIFKKCSYAQM